MFTLNSVLAAMPLFLSLPLSLFTTQADKRCLVSELNGGLSAIFFWDATSVWCKRRFSKQEFAQIIQAVSENVKTRTWGDGRRTEPFRCGCLSHEGDASDTDCHETGSAFTDGRWTSVSLLPSLCLSCLLSPSRICSCSCAIPLCSLVLDPRRLLSPETKAHKRHFAPS